MSILIWVHVLHESSEHLPTCTKYSDCVTGGLRQGSACISGKNAYGFLKFEGGVHRVQRVPVTESGGRIHTSTMSVAVMPKPEEVVQNFQN